VVALVAAVVAVGVLPAVLALLGARVNALAPRRMRRRTSYSSASNASESPPGR
jgi:uncharacterized membrane protein YdfJ with MMPL/SSD domain